MSARDKAIIELINRLSNPAIADKLTKESLFYLSRCDSGELVKKLTIERLEYFRPVPDLQNILIPAEAMIERRHFRRNSFFYKNVKYRFFELMPVYYDATDETSACAYDMDIPLYRQELFAELGGIEALHNSAFTYVQAKRLISLHQRKKPLEKWSLDPNRANHFLIIGKDRNLVIMSACSEKSGDMHSHWRTVYNMHPLQSGRLFLKNS